MDVAAPDNDVRELVNRGTADAAADRVDLGGPGGSFRRVRDRLACEQTKVHGAAAAERPYAARLASRRKAPRHSRIPERLDDTNGDRCVAIFGDRQSKVRKGRAHFGRGHRADARHVRASERPAKPIRFHF